MMKLSTLVCAATMLIASASSALAQTAEMAHREGARIERHELRHELRHEIHRERRMMRVEHRQHRHEQRRMARQFRHRHDKF